MGAPTGRATSHEHDAPSGLLLHAAGAEKTAPPVRSYPVAKCLIGYGGGGTRFESRRGALGRRARRGRANAPGPGLGGLLDVEKRRLFVPQLPCSGDDFRVCAGAAAAMSPGGNLGDSPRRSGPNAPHPGLVGPSAVEKPM